MRETFIITFFFGCNWLNVSGVQTEKKFADFCARCNHICTLRREFLILVHVHIIQVKVITCKIHNSK